MDNRKKKDHWHLIRKYVSLQVRSLVSLAQASEEEILAALKGQPGALGWCPEIWFNINSGNIFFFKVDPILVAPGWCWESWEWYYGSDTRGNTFPKWDQSSSSSWVSASRGGSRDPSWTSREGSRDQPRAECQRCPGWSQEASAWSCCACCQGNWHLRSRTVPEGPGYVL